MAQTSGVDAQVLSLPAGGGAVRGLGSSFSTDLNTGTGGYGIPLELPNGPNGVRPKLDLTYQSGGPTGPFGMGWTLGTMAVTRMTEAGVPTYGADDRFALPGVGEIVPMPDGTWRPEVDTLGWLIRRTGAGWEITDRDGVRYDLGLSAGGQLVVGDTGQVAMWLLEQMTDTTGATVTYTYRSDQLLDTVAWGTWELHWHYEPRPDPLLTGRYGVLVETTDRCAGAELHAPAQPASLVRNWQFGYTQAPGSGHSMLHTVTLRGHAADGSTADAPVLTLGYTGPASPTLITLDTPAVPGAGPSSLATGRGELVDVDGDGLPDVLEVGAAGARVWRNLGAGHWQPPYPLSQVPPPLRGPHSAFADVAGEGTADLLVLDRPMSGYYPLHPLGGFGDPVLWRDAPAVRLVDGTSRLVDLDGDGVTDLLAQGRDGFTLWFREDGGWSQRPVVVPAGQAPPVSLTDPRVRLADLTGDGLQDLARVRGGRVTFWPYLGHGHWGEARDMGDLPGAPDRLDPARLHLVDVDGDGAADCVYVDAGRVVVWYNRSAGGWSAPVVVRGTPACRPSDVRVVDLLGTGVAGVLFSAVAAGLSRTGACFLDLSGGRKPYLLETIDGGVGLTTTIEYEPSTSFAAADRAAGAPWLSFCPFPVQCVATVTDTDKITGVARTIRHRYREGHYDAVAHAFAGFAQVTVDEVGDDTMPTLRTVNHYAIGLAPDDPTRRLHGAERLRYGAMRRRLVATEKYSPDGSPLADHPLQTVTYQHEVVLTDSSGGRWSAQPRQTRTHEQQWERAAAPFAHREITYLDYDEHGNVLRQRELAWRVESGLTTVDLDITTVASFASNPATHVIGKPARLTETDGTGALVSVTVHRYDGPDHEGLPEGQVDAGLLTRVDRLAVPDALATALYGADQPDWVALGYQRLPVGAPPLPGGVDGWWAPAMSYARKVGGNGLLTVECRGPNGDGTLSHYDATRQYITRVTDAVGNVRTAEVDLRTGQVTAVTEAGGARTADAFDPLGRVVATIAPGDNAALPTVEYVYAPAGGGQPTSASAARRERSGAGETLDEVCYVDGRGQPLAKLVEGEGDAGREWLATDLVTYGARGAASARYLPGYRPTPAYQAPDPDALRLTMRYDAMGRMLAQQRPGGAAVTQEFGPGYTVARDEATNAGVRHHVVTTWLDAERRVRAVDHETSTGTATTSYGYAGRDRLTTVAQAGGGVTTMTYDLAGRLLRQDAPDTGQTVFVLDPAGNQVLRRLANGGTVHTAFDALHRKLASFVDGAVTPTMAWHYLDASDPAPPDGVRGRVGRLYRVIDPVGSVTFAYDPVGRVVQTRRSVTALDATLLGALAGHELVTDITYDALGREVEKVLPAPAPGGARRIVSYAYSRRGLAESSPGVVTSASYDEMGRLRRVQAGNGVVTTADFDPDTGAPTVLRVVGPGNVVLREHTYGFDAGGLLHSVAAPLGAEQASYGYDDLGHLTGVDYGDGTHGGWSITPAGNVSSVDGLGALTYDPAPGSAKVIAAGAHTYGYDAAGFLTSAPYGTLHYNGLDDLVRAELTDGRVIQQVFDCQGGRGVRTVAGGATTKVSVTADPHLEVSDGTATVWVTFAGQRVLGVTDASSAFLHPDAQGTGTLYTDAAGALLARVLLDPYGKLRAVLGPGGAATVAIVPGGVRYHDQPFDLDIGLLFLGRRGFDPTIARFISPDRTVAAVYAVDSWNPYCYGRGNPLRNADPTGRFSIGDFFAILAVAVVVAVLVVAGAFAGGTTWTLIPGVVIGAQALFWGAAAGMAAGAILGGIAAAKAGADIWKGVLFGAAVGGACGALGGALGSAVFNALGGMAAVGFKSAAAFVLSGAIGGALSGAGTGAAIGFAGGKGSAESFWKNVGKGALIGFVTGAILGFAGYYLNSPGMGLNIGLNKLDPRVPAAGGLSEQADFLDNSASLGVSSVASGTHGGSSLIGLGTSPGSLTLVHIPLDWVPQYTSTMASLGADVMVGWDKYQVAGMRFGDILFLLLEAMPYFVGVTLTLLDSGHLLDWAKNPVRDFFAMPA